MYKLYEVSGIHRKLLCSSTSYYRITSLISEILDLSKYTSDKIKKFEVTKNGLASYSYKSKSFNILTVDRELSFSRKTINI